MRLSYLLTALTLLVLFSCKGSETEPRPGGSGGSGGIGAGGTGGDNSEPGLVQLKGAVSKGPFIQGSSVSVSPVDDKGRPSGQVFQTHTINNLGEFALEFFYQGPISLEGSGYYYNEIQGGLSTAPIVLRAYAEIESFGLQSSYVNPITHMAFNRTARLMADGASFGEARQQAEDELFRELAIGPRAPDALGSEMNLLGGDTVSTAYVFAVSSILAQAAKIREERGIGSLDANLQDLMNSIAIDMEDGNLSASLRSEFDRAKEALPAQEVMDLLASYLKASGSSSVVPDLGRVLDSDGDGIPNAADNCPLIFNPKQEKIVGICKIQKLTHRLTDFHSLSSFEIRPVDLDGDDSDDLLIYQYWGTGYWMNTLSSGLTDSAVQWTHYFLGSGDLRDWDGDGDLDFLLFQHSSAGEEQAAWLLRNDGNGNFSKPLELPLEDNEGREFRPYFIADFNGDQRPDLLGHQFYSSSGFPDSLSFRAGTATGFGPPERLSFDAASMDIDIDHNGTVDLLGFDSDPPSIIIHFGAGDGTFLEGKTFVVQNEFNKAAIVKGSKTSRLALFGSKKVNVLEWRDDSFISLGAYDLPKNTYALEAVELNRDGVLYLILGSQSPAADAGLAIYQALEDELTLAHHVDVSNSIMVVTADMNGDGTFDLVLLDEKFDGTSSQREVTMDVIFINPR